MEDEGRDIAPMLSANAWNKMFRSCGLSGVDVELKVFQHDDEHEISAIDSSVVPDQQTLSPEATVMTIVYTGKDTNLCRSLQLG